MRSKLFLLATGLCLALLSAAVLSAGPMMLEEADLYAYSDPYEVRAGAAGDVYLSDVGVGVWHVSATGAYTTYQTFGDVVDARPDGAGDVWYTDATNVVYRLNTAAPTPTVTEWELADSFGLWGLALDDAGRVWITQEAGPYLYRFDPGTTELCTYTVDVWSTYVLFEDGYAWTANWGTDRIRRVNAAGQVTSWPIPWTGSRAYGLAADDQGGVWWADRGLAAVVRLDPAANQMTRYNLPLGTRPGMVDVRAGKVWYTEWTLNMTGTVGILDPAVATGVTATVGTVPGIIAPLCTILGAGDTTPVPVVDLGAMAWTTDTLLPALEQDGWVIYELPAGSRPFGVAGSGDYVWITDRGRTTLARLQATTMPLPGIDLEKATNGEDADAAPGPAIVVGDAVTWTYVVSNTGDVDLVDVAVVDDNGTPADPGDDYICQIGLLAVGATDDSCLQVGIATAGLYENIATVTGDYESTTMSDTDLSHYTGVTVAVGIHLEKYTNGQDADAAPGPAIEVGDAVTWTYVVSNTGDADLVDVTVVDDNGTPGNPGDDYTCEIGLLPAGAADDTCIQVGIATAGLYENIAVVTGEYQGMTLSDTDLSHYTGVTVAVGIDLEKSTNGHDADDPPGPSIPAGDPVTWRYVVTNTGQVALTDVTVTDDNGTPGEPADDYVCLIAALPAGGVDDTTCVLAGVAMEGPFGNVAVADGHYGDVLVQDIDASHYVGTSPRFYVFLPLVHK